MAALGVKIALAAALLVASGCAHGPRRFDPGARRTCLVLSVGGTAGVAHLGAIAAVKEARVPISCVVGNSMGALIGAVYATAPAADTTARFQSLLRAYESATLSAAHGKGLRYAIVFGAAAAVLSSGALPALAAGAGYALGVKRTAKLDRDRLISVMDAFFEKGRIEALPVAYATFHHRVEGQTVTLATATTGSLAEAVGDSVANPFLFEALDVKQTRAFDPGADRAAAVPVEDACRLFPDANLLVVNVTGAPTFTSAAMRCPVLEVRIPPPPLKPEEAIAFGAAFDAAVAAGHHVARAALDR